MKARSMPATNAEVAAHIRERVADRSRGIWSWVTDGCTYEQHIRFVDHRNKNWNGTTAAEFDAFALAYADAIESQPDVAASTQDESVFP